ncbi:MAG: hypothetical protein M1823_006078 [Watsoniomyces obsoletus]|nr:MAG: hypothetical protein M1823_006078 [Watsoniomyces obsoletus]
MNEQPPEGCHHYTSIAQVPWDVHKYWWQRHDIFSRYDQGIWMTDDAWFGVTPEPIANKIAERLAKDVPKERDILVDTFSGTGGNAIAFARSTRWKRIVAIEKDAKAIQCAKHNAAIYGVEDDIEWHHGDCFELIPSLSDVPRAQLVVFASPPWGGPGYSCDAVFNLHTMQPYPLQMVYEVLIDISDVVVLYLPRTSDLRQLAALVGEGKQIRVTHYCMNGASKALCAFYGPYRDK